MAALETAIERKKIVREMLKLDPKKDEAKIKEMKAQADAMLKDMEDLTVDDLYVLSVN
jgi:hypothetical protein